MRCPFCDSEDTKVVDTRSMEENTCIRRRRLCEKCNERFTTYEKMDILPITVVKRDLTREKFDKDKLLKGLLSACNKRPIPITEIELIAKEVENKIYTSNRKEISSKEIGELIMRKLKSLDEVAYVRFASVYREFQDVNSFIDEVGKILEPK